MRRASSSGRADVPSGGACDEVEWARLTGPEIRAVAARTGALAVLPIGSLEQHGPHLPVITDTASASAAAIRAARLVAGEMPVLVLPGLWTGMSEHHLPFGGTISLNFSELQGVLRGVVRSLRAIGFARLLIVNGHGGNVEPLAVAARELAHEFGLPVVACTPWYPDPRQGRRHRGDGGDAGACLRGRDLRDDGDRAGSGADRQVRRGGAAAAGAGAAL